MRHGIAIITGKQSMHIQIIVGSVREGRVGLPVAEWVLEQAQGHAGLTVDLIDLKAWDLPIFSLPSPPAMGDYKDPLQQRWAAKIAEADGFIFVTPEYNHGYSPALKNALDYLYAEWRRKPAAFVAYGNAGGARAVEQLRQVLTELQIAALSAALHIAGVWGKVKEGRFVADEQDTRRFDRLMDDLLWWTDALHSARGKG
jgi:NAD(P)H-dependent FMN reductase